MIEPHSKTVISYDLKAPLKHQIKGVIIISAFAVRQFRPSSIFAKSKTKEIEISVGQTSGFLLILKPASLLSHRLSAANKSKSYAAG